jgi:hypothetical protein
MRKSKDIRVLRELAMQYADIAADPIQNERRDLWRKHNSLKPTRIPIHVRSFPEVEIPVMKLDCEDEFYRWHERMLRRLLFQNWIGDDYVFEPWITQRATLILPPHNIWGVPFGRIPSPDARGSWMFDPGMKNLEDIDRLATPKHAIDEEATRLNVERITEAIGDIITVNVDRSPEYLSSHADISYYLACFRGLEQVLWDMMDNPKWLHTLLGRMRDGILKAQQEAEDAGDFQTGSSNNNQVMPYAEELPLPEANSAPVTRDKLQTFMAAQEFTLVSPQMHDEFLLQYQMPIMEKFGLVAYGCCEDLTEKIDMLRKIPNLRRIAVTPVANVRRCAEQIGADYVISWRPNPATMVCCGFDPDYIRGHIRQALEECRGCFVDITLKDVSTVEGDPARLREWVRITREVAEDF